MFLTGGGQYYRYETEQPSTVDQYSIIIKIASARLLYSGIVIFQLILFDISRLDIRDRNHVLKREYRLRGETRLT